MRHNVLGRNVGISLTGHSKDVIGSGVGRLRAFRNVNHMGIRRISSNSVYTLMNVRKFRVKSAIYSCRGPRTLPPVTVSRPAVDVLFAVGSSPFFNGRNGFIASHRVRSHLVGRLSGGLTLHIHGDRRSNG